MTDPDYDTKFKELREALEKCRDVLNRVQPIVTSTQPAPLGWEVLEARAIANKALCPDCLDYLRPHDHRCPKHPDYDPTSE